MFEEAIRYPWKGEKNVETIAIGGLLSIFSFLVLPMFLVYGYVVRVIRQVSAGDDEVPPTFGDWEELFVDGLKAFAVVIVYSLIPAAVFTFAVFSWIIPVAVTSGGDGSGAVGALGLLFGLFVMLVAVVISLAFVYVVPAAIAAFARTGRLGAAFSPAELRSIGSHRGYATGWLVAVAVTILASIVGGAASATVLGVLLVPFVTFYGTVSAAYAIGEGIRDIPVVEHDDETVTTGQPVA